MVCVCLMDGNGRLAQRSRGRASEKRAGSTGLLDDEMNDSSKVGNRYMGSFSFSLVPK